MIEEEFAKRVPRWRYIVDIIAIAAFSILLPLGLMAAGLRPLTPTLGLAFGVGVQLICVAFVWVLLRLRGERLRDIGLRTPDNWFVAVAIAIMVAAFFFLLSWGLESAGLHRDMSRFAALQGNLELLLWSLLVAVFSAGFGEEVIFRGFVFRSFAGGLGDGRLAWILAAILQAALFALAHGYQGPIGLFFTGGAAFIIAIAFLLSGRNLWPFILGHALYDGSRFVDFYFSGAH
jgi:membrane protease YdiL (CAAX protease family)